MASNRIIPNQKEVVQGCKYIDLDSTYRNRNNYPNPNDFVIPINYPGRNSTASSAIDPILDAIPYSFAGGVVGNSPDANHITLDANETAYNNFYINSILDINPNSSGQQFVKIISYDGVTKIATLETPLTSVPMPGDTYYIRKTAPFFIGTVSNTLTPTNNTFSLNSSASLINDVYNDSYVRVLTGSNTGQVSRVMGYSGNNKKVTLFKTLPSTLAIGDAIELISYTRDNASTLLSAASISSAGQSAYYELELLWISIPNKILNVGYGGTINNYPYLYVQLYNEGKRQSNQVILSNNPNSTLALFKVPVDCDGDPFITLKHSGSRQVVRFEPDQDLRFTVTLPNGTPLSFADADSFSPLAPNPLVQVNALFGIKKI